MELLKEGEGTEAGLPEAVAREAAAQLLRLKKDQPGQADFPLWPSQPQEYAASVAREARPMPVR